MASQQRTDDRKPVNQFPRILAIIEREAYRAASDNRYRRAARASEGGGK